MTLPYKLFSIAMILALALSGSGLMIDFHFCEGKLKRFSIFGKAKTCQEMAQLKKSCCAKSKSVKTTCGKDGKHDGCCKNNAIQFDADIEQIPPNNIAFSDLQNDMYLTFVGRTALLTPILNLPVYKKYIPPLILEDFYVLYGVFLL